MKNLMLLSLVLFSSAILLNNCGSCKEKKEVVPQQTMPMIHESNPNPSDNNPSSMTPENVEK